MHSTPALPASLPARAPTRPTTSTMALLALGVVYGDIGTSPLYAVKETFNPEHGIPLVAANILGGVSAIFWSLMLIVTLKYVTLVLRATNRGEGGIMALLALATSAVRGQTRLVAALMAIGVVGAALFYGDAVLTPAISVLSAVEGLEVGTTAFKPYVMPISLGILVGLFLIQRHGTGVVGMVFGPVCLAWFVSIGAVGLWNIVKEPSILAALHPGHALAFATSHGVASFVVLGSVLLAVTGAEALYADIGHFGKRAVRVAWFSVVAPCLVLNYFGQGALLLRRPDAVSNPFFLSYPDWALYPMVALATAATVIASQATISGAYSMTQQAVQLGYLPRMAIRHTSETTMGQIYIPAVNWVLLVAVGAAVVGFGNSTNLAAAYGVAVMGTMLATTILTFFVVRYEWRYSLWICALATAGFLVVDATFFAAALHKLLEGGWFPLLLGAAVFVVMTTWRRGRREIVRRLDAEGLPLEAFLATLQASHVERVNGTAVYLISTPDATPRALLHNLKHYKVLHGRNIFVHADFRDIPFVPAGQGVECVPIGKDCWRVMVQYGFLDRPDIPLALAQCGPFGLELEPMDVSYFLSRERIVPTDDGPWWQRWRMRLFAAMSRNAGSATDFFEIPANKVVELGARVEL